MQYRGDIKVTKNTLTLEGKIVVFKTFRTPSDFCDEAFYKIVMYKETYCVVISKLNIISSAKNLF